MKHIKTFERFDSNESDESTPKFLNSIDQMNIVINGVKYNRFLETEEFIYFTVEDDEDCLMYRKSNLELVSDNYFAQEDLFEKLLDRTWTWASKDAIFAADELAKQN